MKPIFKTTIYQIVIFVITVLVFVGCENYDIEGKNPNNKPLIVHISSNWGASKDDIKAEMEGYILKKEDENFLYYYKDKWDQIVSYEFYDGKLCTTVLMIKNDRISELGMLDFITEYIEIGKVDNSVLYYNEDNNAIATYSQNMINASTYLTIGFTRLDLEYISEYTIGDYYNIDGKEGVVFEVNSTGKHGKIVGLSESQTTLKWASGEVWEECLIGSSAQDEENGQYIMYTIQSITNYKSNYPAFVWCENLGDDWFLPAKDEWKTLTSDKTLVETLNKTLSTRGTPLPTIGSTPRKTYWSATEYDYCRAWAWYTYDSEAFTTNKGRTFYVRAIATF